MLSSIRITNSFAHADRFIEFKPGMTTITGPNGIGKSEILTMIRWALFGTAALPTKAEDYKDTKVNLHFIVRDVPYRVDRTTVGAKLYREGELIALGTKPVNAKVVETFGYGLAVFDTANVANQGVIEALGAMMPAERKRLVDSTIGLNVLDDLVRYCTDEGGLLVRERATLLSTAVPPEAPVLPQGYRTGLEAERTALAALDAERADLHRRIVSTPPLWEEPACPEPRPLAELETISIRRTGLQSTITHLIERVQEYPAAEFTLEQLEEIETGLHFYDHWQLAHKFCYERFPKPDTDRSSVELHISHHERYSLWQQQEKLRKKGSHTCPSCSYSWPVAQADMDKLGTFPMGGLIEPVGAKAQWESLLEAWNKYEKSLPERAPHEVFLALHPDPPPKPRLGLLAIEQQRRRCEAAATRMTLIQQQLAAVDELNKLPDVGQALILRRSYESELKRYLSIKALHDQLPGWMARKEELGDTTTALNDLMNLQVACQTYDKLQAAYATSVTAYEAIQLRIADLATKVAEWQNAKAALLEMKAEIKTQLVPSLSRVSSLILSRMTGHALSEVVIDPDFDIRVNGKPMAGLSGAGKAAANLAIRIGLGQVLTNKVFSLFMGDELDANMDVDRARFMAESLRNLSGTIGQIIIVSHKTPEADHYIRL
jgi:exonuclease SbcC